MPRAPATPSLHAPQQNHLLAALSPAERDRLSHYLRLIPLALGKVLYESGDVQRYVYFPTDSIVSLTPAHPAPSRSRTHRRLTST